MLYDEHLARAQRAFIEPDVTRAVTQAEARQLRKALRRARRRHESPVTQPTVAEPVVAAADTSVGTEAPATVDA